MPERAKYKHLFERNPFEGKNPREVFSLLHWGNKHDKIISMEAPEPMVMLGIPKILKSPNALEFHFTDGEAFLVLGTVSNELYIVPRENDLPKRFIPEFSRKTASYIAKIKQTDYLSMKGGKKEHYYYHKHERPYPELWLHHKSGIGYLRASRLKDGKPSYAVGKEGIVG